MAALSIPQIICLWRLWKRIKSRQLKRRLRFLWRPSLQRRGELGEYRLVQELYFDDHETFFRYFRMSPRNFDFLLSLVAERIERLPSPRGYVSARERLAVTLRLVHGVENCIGLCAVAGRGVHGSHYAK